MQFKEKNIFSFEIYSTWLIQRIKAVWSARPEESMNRISLIFYYIVELQSPLSSLSKRKAILMLYYQPNLQGQARIFQNQITLVLLYSMSLKNLKYLSNGMLWMTLM